MNNAEEILALDVGGARTGVARANSTAKIPEPLPVLELQGEPLLQAVALMAKEQGSDLILVGLPLGLNSLSDTAQTIKSREFAEELAKSGHLPVKLVDEALSTALAEKWRTRYPDASEDSLAACVILERYMGTE